MVKLISRSKSQQSPVSGVISGMVFSVGIAPDCGFDRLPSSVNCECKNGAAVERNS